MEAWMKAGVRWYEQGRVVATRRSVYIGRNQFSTSVWRSRAITIGLNGNWTLKNRKGREAGRTNGWRGKRREDGRERKTGRDLDCGN